MAIKKKAAKPAPKKAAKPVAKPARPTGGKPAKAAKPAAKSARPSGGKPTSKPARSTGGKAVAKPAAKPAPKKAAKPAPKAVAKSAAKKVAKPVAKPVAKKPEVKKPAPIVAKPAAASAIKPTVKQAIKELKKEAKKPVPVKEIKPIKTSVSTSVRYQPDFTKSVLDKAVEEKPQGPMVRYNDADLIEFRELIQRKLESAKKELGYLQGLITRKDETGGDGDDGRYMTMEDGSVSMEREQLSQMASRQITYIDHLEKALMRIENKTYGICRVTGKLIDKARLRAVPHATLSMEAKMGIVKGPQIAGE
jgi:RNA polymerase-binding transcription factor DksA